MSLINPLSCHGKTDWTKCCLCQTVKKEKLISPSAQLPCSSEADGYLMIAANIPLFQAIKQLPIKLDMSRLDDGSGYEETLRKNNGKYHRSCRLMFANRMLERARKRAANNLNDPCQGPSKIRRTGREVQQCFCVFSVRT